MKGKPKPVSYADAVKAGLAMEPVQTTKPVELPTGGRKFL
jgi:hypothetical protein